MSKGWVKVTFEKEYLEGDRELCEVIQPFGHGVAIHHKPEWDFLVYGDLDAYNARNTERYTKDFDDGIIARRIEAIKRNPDDRYKRQTA